MPGPSPLPIGLELARTAKAVSRAFDQALVAAGGSAPMWLVLISLKTRQLGNQRELAEAVGIQEATLTHHLNAMEADGLLTRQRDPGNRRIHVIELTEEGEAMFRRLRRAALAFDQRLSSGLTGEEVASLEGLLHRLHDNVAGSGGSPA
jgi:MarR family transcriptional regulator, transcriptional regulator for hemolysin